MLIGMVILAPLSLPITVIVVANVVNEEPNNVLTVVPVKVNEVPISDLDNTAPVVVFNSGWPTVVVVIPVPVNDDSNLISEIVATYPLASNVEVAPK
jgi:hypothetical protein